MRKWPFQAFVKRVFNGGFAICFSGGLIFSTPVWAFEHYLCSEKRSLQEYNSMRWFKYELPITVYVPPVPFQVEQPDMYYPLVQKAFFAWSERAPFIQFQFVDHPKKAMIKIQWKDDFKNEGAWGKAFLPILYRSVKGKLRHKSVVFLAVRAQLGSGMTGLVNKPVLFSADELLSIAKHEVGHALGLPHSPNESDVMCGGCWGFYGNTLRDISEGDIATLYALYNLPLPLKKNPCP